MEYSRFLQRFADYRRALTRLEESLNMEMTSSVIMDGIIQRFEFTYELSWKLMKLFLNYQGINEISTPREVFREAFRAGIIDNGDEWIDMMIDRNRTSHIYNEQTALEIYQKIKEKHFANLYQLQALDKEVEK